MSSSPGISATMYGAVAGEGMGRDFRQRFLTASTHRWGWPLAGDRLRTA